MAMAKVFSSGLSGNSKTRAELAASEIPLEVEIPVLRCRAGEAKLRACFEPLGYQMEATPLPLDEQFPDWGSSPYFSVKLTGTHRLSTLLSQLYVLLPALDGVMSSKAILDTNGDGIVNADLDGANIGPDRLNLSADWALGPAPQAQQCRPRAG